MGFQDSFRFNFSPSNPWSNISFPPQQDDEEDDEYDLGPMGSSPYIKQLNEVMAREQPAMRKYMENMAQAPTRENYKPGKLSSIGAILAGVGQSLKGDPMGGFQAMETIRDAPYRRAYEEWAMRDKGYGAAAKLENEQLKQTAENLLKMADEEVKRKGANAGAARAKASLSTADTYSQFVKRPRWQVGSNADKTFFYDVNSGETKDFGQSPSAAMRLFQGKQNELNRGLTRSEGNLDRTAAENRAKIVSNRRPIRHTVSKPVDAAESFKQDQLAMFEATQSPEVSEGAQSYLKTVKGNNGSVTYALNPPSPSDKVGTANYKAFLNWLKVRRENNLKKIVTVPYGYEPGGFQDWYDPNF